MDEDLSEVESALYCNCLLLGYDAAKTGVELSRHMFRHSNPKGGEALLHFLLSCIRPQQCQKDFLGVWPIFDARQARDFRKVVQGQLAELEASGNLPRSNSRLSSLATCCGERFIELMWQLSAHALREVLLRMTSLDNKQVPVRLTEVAQQAETATALEPVLKARIALQRKRFLTSAAAAVERQNEWAGLADEITAEHRALSAEQASLQQELQHEKSTGLGSSEDGEATELRRNTAAQWATQTWSSLMAHTEESRSMTSGHLQDVLTQREHRYRIDGATLREAMQSSRQLEGESAVPDAASVSKGVRNAAEPLDIADVLQTWTGALQASQQQLQQGRPEEPLIANGEGSHGQALEAALAEHKKHLANLQALVSTLKQQAPQSESTVQQLRDQIVDAMEDNAQAGGPLSEGLYTPLRKPRGPDAPTGHPKAARLQLVPPTPAMKLKGRNASGLGPLESLDEREGNEIIGPDKSEETRGRTKVGSRLVGSLLEDEPSSSKSMAELRHSVHVAASEARAGDVAASGPLTAGSRNQLFVTPAANLQGARTFESSVAIGRSKARLNMESGVPGKRGTGVAPQLTARSIPPRSMRTGQSAVAGKLPGGFDRKDYLQKATDSSSSVAPGTSYSSMGEFERSSNNALASEHATERAMGGPRESSASRQSVPDWAAERILSPPLQVEVEEGGNDPDDIFDLLAPLKAQDLNIHSPSGHPRVGRSPPSGVG